MHCSLYNYKTVVSIVYAQYISEHAVVSVVHFEDGDCMSEASQLNL